MNIAHDEITEIDEHTTFKDFLKYLPIEAHKTEVFKWCKKNCLLSEVEDLFHETLQNGKRLNMIFITEHGKSAEKLLGIVTPWDILGTSLEKK